MTEKRDLLEQEIPRLRRYARVLTKDTDDADDLVQDCLLRALDNLDRWQAGTNMRAWLFTIMHRLFLNSTRRKPMVSVEDLDPSRAVQVSPASQEHSVRLAEVQQAFATLTKDHQEIILLVAIERLHYEEAAGILNVAVGTVRSRLFRAREALEKALGHGDLSALSSLSRSRLSDTGRSGRRRGMAGH
jgi:RNA polymerase sigma-70 factor (ECF subfamily)